MTNLSQMKFEAAEKIFAVSNTPSFLVRKLRDDDSVRAVAENFSGLQILSEIKKAAKKKPKTLGDCTRPYVLLVALWAMRGSW